MTEIATFMTIGGAPVVLSHDTGMIFQSLCHGCAESRRDDENFVRNWTDIHADRCRAVARY